MSSVSFVCQSWVAAWKRQMIPWSPRKYEEPKYYNVNHCLYNLAKSHMIFTNLEKTYSVSPVKTLRKVFFIYFIKSRSTRAHFEFSIVLKNDLVYIVKYSLFWLSFLIAQTFFSRFVLSVTSHDEENDFCKFDDTEYEIFYSQLQYFLIWSSSSHSPWKCFPSSLLVLERCRFKLLRIQWFLRDCWQVLYK